jgi:two-component system, OmpR family, alkaline phosphatase synthesis response regulator PhoP
MNSWPQDRIYRRTASGDDAWSSSDPAIPSDYRRILRVIEGDTHSDVVRGLLRQFPDALLTDWLAELEELGLIESAPADPTRDLDFTNPLQTKQFSALGISPDDTVRIEKQALAARTALDRTGTFLSPDRLENRPLVAKKAREITVLIVEDDPDQAALAKLRVSTAGYAVRVARDCKELLDEIRSRPLPDLLLLDILLPDGNGFDVLANMRRHPRLALLPIVMLTVLAKPEEVRRGLDLGADGYITKPYSKKILTDTIRAVLKHA